MNINDINRFKSPEEARKEREDEKSFPVRFFGLLAIAAVLAFVVCGAYRIESFWGVWGCISLLLMFAFLKEA
ncbi:MAG: hypothetical protein JSS87_15160 [Acidobacteria bacterium]|nr:hypothetical protein [Acidobacteriota bacterium]